MVGTLASHQCGLGLTPTSWRHIWDEFVDGSCLMVDNDDDDHNDNM